MPPEKLGRYEITRELGRGAMGVVYEAVDPNIGRTVALKTVRMDAISSNPEELALRFKNEARAAGRLNHPNIVTVYDAGEQDGVLYIAMELLEGRTLQALLAEQRRLPLDRAIDISRQICAGLDFAHAKGIVHRDIKPANIILAGHGFVKITDFGIARTGEAMTLTGQILGTPNYMSPEQVMGKALDSRSDLFSVGVILYEMVTGERPFDAQSITTVMYKIVHETPIPPRALDVSIPAGLSAVIEKSLAKAPDQRYHSGAEMAAALQNDRGGVPSQATTAARTVATDADATATFAGPAPHAPSAVGGRYETGPREAGGVPTPSPAAPVEQPRKRRRGIYGIGIPVLAGLVVLAWVLTQRAQPTRTAANTSQVEVKPPAAVPAPPASPAAPTPSETQSQTPPANSEDTAAPTTPPDKNSASIAVNSTPPGAAILVDKKPTGQTTPATVILRKGKHTVAVQMEGFQPSSAKFRVHGGEQFEFAPTLAVAMPGMPKIVVPAVDLSALQNLKGLSGDLGREQARLWQQWARSAQQGQPAVMVATRPAGARVFVDGKDTGKTTPAMVPLSAEGTHRVRVELQGFEPVEQDVKAAAYSPGQMQVVLRPAGSSPQPPQ